VETGSQVQSNSDAAARLRQFAIEAEIRGQPPTARGASIEEMMQATDWQQHSVRGFLAGTVKRKLGFPLTSSKPNDGVRRYRVETRRAR
jgi:hypothetical protein